MGEEERMSTPRTTEGGGGGGNGSRKPPARQPIHKAVLDGDDCKVIDLTKWCCFTLHHVVEVCGCVCLPVCGCVARSDYSPTRRSSRCCRYGGRSCQPPPPPHTHVHTRHLPYPPPKINKGTRCRHGRHSPLTLG